MSDLRDAFRALRAAPVVSAVAVLSLALGIGANTAIFSILDRVLLRSLPVKEPERLIMLGDGSWTNPIWEQIRDRQDDLFQGAFAWANGRFDLASGGPTDPVDGMWVSGRAFEVLGVPAILGRTFTESDDQRGGGPDGPVAVISYRFWQRHFGGADDVVGRALTIDRVPFTVVGVTGPGFFGLEIGRQFDIAIPLGTEPLVAGAETRLDHRGYWWLDVLARLKPGQTAEGATAALRGVQPQIREATLPTDWRPEWVEGYLKEGLTLVPAAAGDSFLRQRYERPLLVLMGVVALVLLIASANIANLLLARAAARRHELSVRLALGASRGRLARQLLAESLVLAGFGAGLGLVFARWGSALLVGQLSTQTSRVSLDLALDRPVLGFTLAVATATALLFGTLPAFRAARVQPSDVLKEEGRALAGERRLGLGSLLVVVQVALSLVIVVGAGLFVRTFTTLTTLDPGFDRDGLLVVSVNAARSAVPAADRAALFERVREAVAALPGVERAAASVVTPVGGMTWSYPVAVEGEPAPPADRPSAYINVISPGWLATCRTRLVAGRDFAASDRAGALPVALVNEAFVRQYVGGASPIGRTLRRKLRPDDPDPPITIIGVVEDAVYRSLRQDPPATVYLPLAQLPDPRPEIAVTVRASAGPPLQLVRGITQAVAGVDRDVSLSFRTLTDQVDASLTQERLVAILAGFFGALALLLAGIGLYGVTSFAVSRRRAEIGIRMALGADRSGVVRLVLGRVAALVGVGVLAGGGVSLWVSRYAEALLFGLEPRDPATFALAALVLATTGAVAGWLPARRASRLDPGQVLRER